MAEVKYTMSRERKEALEKELDYLENVRTKEVAEMIAEARSYGDLSENSEYDAAKTEQGKLYSHIAEIREQLEHAEIIDTEAGKENGKVNVGEKVSLRDLEFDETEVYEIVGTQEADPREHRISNDSPLGMAVLGHSVGDIVNVEAPDGILQFEIMAIHD